MFTKKSIVLTSVDDGDQKAVLTIENQNSLVEGRLRLYNFGLEPDGILSLGLNENGKVRKCGLSKAGPSLYTFKTEPPILDEFSCAVVQFDKANIRPILFGSTQEKLEIKDSLAAISNSVFDSTTVKQMEEKLDEEGVEYDDELQNEIESAITKSLSEPDKCSDCKYKKCFYGEQTEQKESKRFIDEIKGQIDKLFLSSPSEKYLEEAIPSSKWVRVEFDGDGEYYILGLVYDEDENVKYVCYGVPGVYQKTPPSSLSGQPVWFPLDSENRESFGYWLTYQDADTGESIKAIVE